MALGKCPDGSTTCYLLTHKLQDTTATDFLPAGKLCKVGSGGVLLLETERVQYEDNYCKIDPESTFCKSRTPAEKNTDDSVQRVQGDEKVEDKTKVAATATKSNGGGGEAVVISFMSSSSLLMSCMAAMMMSGKLF